MRFIIADTETSGLTPQDGVCELAWQEIDPFGVVMASDCSLIDPQCSINPSAAGVHGIRDADVVDSPTLEEYMTVVHEFPFMGDECVFIAHNARFDWKHLGPWFNAPVHLCSLKLARHLWKDSPDHKLQTLRMYLDLPFTKGDAHSAMGDVEVVRQLLIRAMGEFDMTMEDLIEISAAEVKLETMPFGKHKGVKFPDLPKQYVKWALANLELEPELRRMLDAQ